MPQKGTGAKAKPRDYYSCLIYEPLCHLDAEAGVDCVRALLFRTAALDLEFTPLLSEVMISLNSRETLLWVQCHPNDQNAKEAG